MEPARADRQLLEEHETLQTQYVDRPAVRYSAYSAIVVRTIFLCVSATLQSIREAIYFPDCFIF